MNQTRNEFKIECEDIINSNKTMSTTNPNLIDKFNQILDRKQSEIIKLINQLENETGTNLDDIKLYITIKK